MTMPFPTLGVAFAAVCVWLGIRIVNRRERWAKRLFVGLAVMPALYVLSFGPACWFARSSLLPFEKMWVPFQMIAGVYQPLVELATVRRIERGWPGIILERYADAFEDDNNRGVVYAMAVALMPPGEDLKCGMCDPGE